MAQASTQTQPDPCGHAECHPRWVRDHDGGSAPAQRKHQARCLPPSLLPESEAESEADTDGDTHSHANANGNTNSHANANASANTHANAHAHANTHTDSHAWYGDEHALALHC